MKRIMKISLLLVAFCASGLTYGYTDPVKGPKSDKITYVTFQNVKVGSVLTLKNENGITMYSEEIKTSGTFSKQFDFTLIPSGSYTFEVENGFEVKVKPLTVSTNNVHITPDEEHIFFKPIVTLKGNKVLISQLSLNMEPLKVKLYYTEKGYNEVLLFSEDFSNDNQYVIEKVLSLSSSYRGNYRVVLSTNDHVYIENLKF